MASDYVVLEIDENYSDWGEVTAVIKTGRLRRYLNKQIIKKFTRYSFVVNRAS